jgi:hypothetical protein
MYPVIPEYKAIGKYCPGQYFAMDFNLLFQPVENFHSYQIIIIELIWQTALIINAKNRIKWGRFDFILKTKVLCGDSY